MKQIVFFLSLIFLSAFAAHKYYHSHCELLLNEKTGSAEAVVELYWHDLEVSLSAEGKKKIKLGDKDFSEACGDYFKKHFVLKDSLGVEAELNFVGTETKGDQLIVYLEFKGVKQFKGFQLANTLLIKEFPQQVNQVNIKKPKKKSLVFTTRNISQKLD